jgi:hypothetical protein
MTANNSEYANICIAVYLVEATDCETSPQVNETCGVDKEKKLHEIIYFVKNIICIGRHITLSKSGRRSTEDLVDGCY